MPHSPNSWFDDEALLVREVQRTLRPSILVPEIRGYEHIEEFRRGGQGVVYLARQRSTSRTVAIKVLHERLLSSSHSRRRFEREIELVAGLRHPHIVRVYDSGTTDDDRLYYVMDFIDGVGLDESIDRRWRTGVGAESACEGTHERMIDVSDSLGVFVKICDGVQFAHQQGVIHRDLKPSNIRMDGGGEPHVLDFGLAKLLDTPHDAPHISQTGVFLGSVPWASPEHAGGADVRVDVRSDVYSLGVILYQMLTGEFPYPLEGSIREALDVIHFTAPRPIDQVNPEIDGELATIVAKTLSKDPDRRYQSAADLAQDVRRYLEGEPIEARRDSAWYTVRKNLKRYKTLARVGGVLLVVLLCFSAAMGWLRSRAVAAERLAAARARTLELQVMKTNRVRDFLDTTLRSVDPWKHPGRDLGPLQEMLADAVARLESGDFGEYPDVEAAIAGTLGWDYWQLGMYESAESLLRRSYEKYRVTLGERHVATMAALNDLARLMTECGRHVDAAELFDRLLAIQQETLGPEAAQTLVTSNNLALDLDWRGKSAEAERLYRATLEAQTRRFGRLDADRLNTLNNLASCLQAAGKIDEARQMYLELVEARRDADGSEAPSTLQARMNLADFHIKAGQLEEAESELRELLETLTTRMGPNHPMTTSAMHNLADVLGERGQLDEALALSRRAFESQVAFAGPDHPTTLNRKNELVCQLISLKRWDEAIPMATELCEQYLRLVGPSEWRALTARGNLAFGLKQLGRRSEAESIWRSIIDDARPDEQATRSAVASAWANLAASYADEAKWSDAEPAYLAALSQMDQAGDGDTWRGAFVRAGYGRVLIELNRLEDAEPMLKAAYVVLSSELGDEHEKTSAAIGYLVKLYELKHDSQQADLYRSKLNDRPHRESQSLESR